MVYYANHNIACVKYEDTVAPESQRVESLQYNVILIDAHRLIQLALQRVIDACSLLHMQSALYHTQQAFFLRDIATAHIIVLGPSVALSDCLAFVQQARDRYLRCGIVSIQQDICPETAHMLIEQGIHALLDEQASEQDLIQAMSAAAQGKSFLSQRARHMLAVARSRSAGNLTERELQVLAHLKQGETNFRIAHKLGLKEKTIEKYLTAIYDKLNVRSRTEAILCLQKLHF